MKASRIIAFVLVLAALGVVMMLIAGGLTTLLNRSTGGWFDSLPKWPQKGVFAVTLVVAAFATGALLHAVLTATAMTTVLVARWFSPVPTISSLPLLIPSPESIAKLEQSTNAALRACAAQMRRRLDGFFLLNLRLKKNEAVLDAPIPVKDGCLPTMPDGVFARLVVGRIISQSDLSNVKAMVGGKIAPENVFADASKASNSVKSAAMEMIAAVGIPEQNLTLEPPSASLSPSSDNDLDESNMIRFEHIISERVRTLIKIAA